MVRLVKVLGEFLREKEDKSFSVLGIIKTVREDSAANHKLTLCHMVNYHGDNSHILNKSANFILSYELRKMFTKNAALLEIMRIQMTLIYFLLSFGMAYHILAPS